MLALNSSQLTAEKDNEKLRLHREIWHSKKILRTIYGEWYDRILGELSSVPGETVEMGSGPGNFKEYQPGIVSSDIQWSPWLDLVFDAHKMPFLDNSVANVVMVDVLHHLARPLEFLNECGRVLKQGGRVIMVEPYPSTFSLMVYRLAHEEPFIMDADCFDETEIRKMNPWDSNQAIPYLLFFKHADRTSHVLRNGLKVRNRDMMSYLLYPLSGGFGHKSFLPESMITMFQRIEHILVPLSTYLAFRCFVVLEKAEA